MHLGAFSLLVPGYEPGIAFFCGTLGFELVEDIPQGHKRWVLVQAPDSPLRIVLARADTDAQRAALGNQAGGRVWLFLHTADFATDHARLTRHGITFEETPRHEPYGTVAVFRDPFGNRWDLIEPKA
jgi:catechol 2,3-dioxygenase-like lactoylglutathione lyase family enzyme